MANCLRRLDGFDYSRAGAYAITICLQPRRPLLANVERERAVRTRLGEIVAMTLCEIPDHFTGTRLDSWVVMPDHVHAIVLMGADRPLGAGSLSVVMGSFKAASSRQVNQHRGTPGAAFWQRGFYDHVVRDEADLARCRKYIADNPRRWSSSRA